VEGKTYEAAGVSLALADSVVDRLRAAVESTGTEGFGAFAGLYPLDDRRLLAATIDSAGTKLVLARKAGRLRQIGADLAAHCVNDVITTGAEPLFFLDYVVGHSLSLEQVAELVEGAAEICREAGCALLGGETAEMPGVYREEELDFAGACVGLVEREDLIDGSRVETGDGARSRHRRRDRRQPLARTAGGPRAGARLGQLGATGGLRLAHRPGRERGGAAQGLQRRHRDVRRRSGRRRGRGARDRESRVIGVLVSGEGTNLQALIDEGLPIAAVASNRRGVRALERAETAGIPASAFELDDFESREERDAAMADWLAVRGVTLVVCAGYMHLLRPVFLDRFDKIVNTHSAPLPEFPGAHPIEDVLAAGVPETAATVHYVDEGVDSGAVIVAEPVPVREDDTVESLRARVQAVEHRLLPQAVRELIS